MMYNNYDQNKSLTEKGGREMERAAYTLPPPSPTKGPPVKLHILTGERYWYQAAFCLWSFAAASGRAVAPVIFDDGSLKLEHIEALKRTFPSLTFVGATQSLERLDAYLPESHFPTLRAQHRVNPMYKKLLNIHVGQTEWRLQMDSDILFFRSPEFILKWYDSPQAQLHLHDIKNAYSGSIDYLSDLGGRPIRPRVNAGLLGIRSIDIDWEQIEFWSKKLTGHGGSAKHVEQTLFALHLSDRECIFPDPKDYVILPEPREAIECKAVMHHYVAYSKLWHFQQNWRRFVIGNHLSQ